MKKKKEKTEKQSENDSEVAMTWGGKFVNKCEI